MTLNILKAFIRSQKRHKVVSAINLIGLTIGLLSTLLILEYVFFERSFDSYHEKADQVVRVAYDRYQDGKLQWKTAGSFYPIGGLLKENYPEAEDYAVLVRKYNIAVSRENVSGDKVIFNEAKAYYATNSLFDLFTIPLIQGGSYCLTAPNTVVISESAAERYFGKDDPMGKILTVNNTETYTVTGVFEDIPPNSHLKSDFLFSFENIIDERPGIMNWFNDLYHTYLLLAPGVDPEEFCNRAMPQLIAQNYQSIIEPANIRDEYYFQPIRDIHLHSNIEAETEPPGNANIVNILFGFAIFLLVIALINYINLTTALSLERAREIGIRKINGAQKIRLVGQFFTEAVFFYIISLFITLVLFFLVNPHFTSAASIQGFNLLSVPGFVPASLLIFLASILLSGIYPALVISSYKPVLVLKGRLKHTAQGLMLRKGLLVVQFVISIALLTGTFITFRQASYLMKKDMGIDYHSAFVIKAPPISSMAERETRADKLLLFRNSLREMTEVEDFAFTTAIPGDEIANFFLGKRQGFNDTDIKAYYSILFDDRYLDFFSVKMLAGRKFRAGETAAQQNIIMNKLAADRFGYPNPEDAVGKLLTMGPNEEVKLTVIGVCDDFYYRSIKMEPMPTVLLLNDFATTNLCIRLNTNQANAYATALPKLKAEYGAIFPDQPFETISLDNKMYLDLKPDKTFASVFTIFSILAIFIAVIGIIGLTSVNITQNLKELGVRKTFGAEISDMSGLLSKQLLVQFILSIVIAVPLSYFGYKNWFLASYIHRIDLNWWFFSIPVVILITVITFVLVTLARKVIKMNLLEVLQYE